MGVVNDIRLLVLDALADGPLPRHLPITREGRSVERVLAGFDVYDTLLVARTLGELQSGPWPLVEITEWGAFRITAAGEAHRDFAHVIEGVA